MSVIKALTRKRNTNFDFCAKRRREIVLHARYVGAADTEDLSRWLIAWVWHNRKAKDQIWSLMECAKNMGRKITEAEASAITEEASITRKHLSADNLARFLGVTFEQRQRLGLTTIGSVNVKKRARRELRRRNNRLAKEAKRRAKGMRSRAEYEGNSLSATRPWEAMNMSRRTWERRRNKTRVASVGTPSLIDSEDTLATASVAERVELKWTSEGQNAPRRPEGPNTVERKVFGLTTDKVAVPEPVSAYEDLPLELRFLALGLEKSVGFENLARAA
jgi:hypothetical protein